MSDIIAGDAAIVQRAYKPWIHSSRESIGDGDRVLWRVLLAFSSI